MTAAPGGAAGAGAGVVTPPFRPRLQMVLIAVAVLVGNYARTALGPVQETVQRSLSLSDNQMALLQGLALAIPLVVASAPLGMAVDRLSRVRLMVGLTIFNTAGLALTALAPGFALLFLARCAAGLTGPAAAIVALSLVADLCAPERRGRATMLVGLSQMAGMAAAFAVGGWLLALLGHGQWRGALLWMIVPMVAAAAFLALMREPARQEIAGSGGSAEGGGWRTGLAELWRRRGALAPLLAGVILVETALGAMLVWSAPMFARCFAVAPDRIGALVATGVIVSGVLGPILGGGLADICHRSGGSRRTVAAQAALAACAAPAGLFGVVHSLPVAAGLLLVMMTAVSAAAGMGTALFTVIVPNEARGLCMSLLFATNILFAVGAAPLLVSVLAGALGGPSSIGAALGLLCASACAVAATCFLVGRRSFRSASSEPQEP